VGDRLGAQTVDQGPSDTRLHGGDEVEPEGGAGRRLAEAAKISATAEPLKRSVSMLRAATPAASRGQRLKPVPPPFSSGRNLPVREPADAVS
jgi:hypothetical protein